MSDFNQAAAGLDSRLSRVEEQCDQLRARVATLEQQVAEQLRELAEAHENTKQTSSRLIACEDRDAARAEAAMLREALIRFDYPHGDCRRGYFCAGCDVDGDDPATSTHHDPDCKAARAALSAGASATWLEAKLAEARGQAIVEWTGGLTREEFINTCRAGGLTALVRHDEEVRAPLEAEVQRLDGKLKKALADGVAESVIANQLRAEVQRQRTVIAGLVAQLGVATKSCRCRGTGTYTRDCTLCGDSTYDHMCNDEERPCVDPVCIANRAALEAAKESQ